MTLLFAGRDNVQNALSWTLTELHKKPEWVQRLREESESLNPNDGVIPYEALNTYHIHLAVVYETLRLWPGVPKNARLVLEDCVFPAIPEWGLSELSLVRGDYLIWSDYDMMRNDKVWSDASGFHPGRHLDENDQFVRPTFPQFHTFGGGPRLCPGAQLATYELVCILSSLLRDFDIKPAGPDAMVYTDSYTMSMKGPFPVIISTRE
ncbi:hypothetical protein ONZ45_g19418 [Pleurotus djamor]|nr:hypothetical protein ONZ45_g19418 [Pleurotus djamor]